MRRADDLFHALADATRRDIVAVVLAGEHSVSELAGRYPMSFAAVQKHVAVLEKAGLLTKRRSGREQLASGDVQAVRSVASLLTELEQVAVAIAYNAGTYRPKKGLKQGYQSGDGRFYGENIFDYLRLSQTLDAPSAPAAISAPAPGSAAVPSL